MTYHLRYKNQCVHSHCADLARLKPKQPHQVLQRRQRIRSLIYIVVRSVFVCETLLARLIRRVQGALVRRGFVRSLKSFDDELSYFQRYGFGA